MLKQAVVLGTLATLLTGCMVSPFDDYDNNDRRYDRNQHDSRYDRDRDHRDRKWDGKYDNDRDHKRPNPYWDQNRQR